jgi:uncharacterized protein YbcI
MKGNSAEPGGPLKSKPAWSDTCTYSTTPALFVCGGAEFPPPPGARLMDAHDSTVARQIAQAACDFELQTRGHIPKSMTVVLSHDTLVITLHGALSPAERALAESPAGAAQVQEFHRYLFAKASGALRQDITRITGMEVSEAATEVATANGMVVQTFANGTIVQVFLLGGSVPADTWSGNVADVQP